MKSKFLKILVIFLIFFQITYIKANEINPTFEEYEKLTEKQKSNVEFIPNEYINYYKIEPNQILKQKDNAMYNLYSAIPSSFDLRNVNGKRLLPGIKNQNPWSLCWAFSTNNVLESYQLMHYSKEYNLSENQPGYVGKHFGDLRTINEANSLYNAIKYWFYGFGPVTESLFGSYFTTNQTKDYKDYLDNNNVPFDISDVVVFPALKTKYVVDNYTINEIKSIMSSYNQDIKQHIINHGAIATGIYWDFYNKQKNLIYNDGSTSYETYASSGHAITIIGWDDDYQGVDIKGTTLKGAWLAMNSWGTDTEYFYISYYDVNVVECLLGVTKLEEKNWNNSYIFPKLIENTSTKKVYLFDKLNVNEIIDSIKILYRTDDSQIKVSISDGYTIYDSITDGNITFGTKKYKFNNQKFNSDKVYVVLETTKTADEFDVALFTKDEETKKMIDIIDLDYNNLFDTEYYYDIHTKNIETGKKINVNIYDDENNDITSKFYLSNSMIVNDYTQLNMLILEDISDTNYIKIVVTCDGVSTELIQYNNGDGSKDNPYVIRTPQEMEYLSYDQMYFELGNNIDLKEEITSKFGIFYDNNSGWKPFDFTSHLDGKGYEISNLTSKQGGLFEKMDNATIKNIKLNNFTIDDIVNTLNYTGTITKEMKNNSEISNVYLNKININSDIIPVGAIAGIIYDGDISNIHIKDSNISSDYTSGIITSKIHNPTNEVNISNIFSKNNKINGKIFGLIGTIEFISNENDIKNIKVKDNIINTNDKSLPIIGKTNVIVSDNEKYDIYETKVLLENNNIKLDNEIYEIDVFNNFDLNNTWSFDKTNSAYLKLFENEFVLDASNIFNLEKYKLQDNVIYQVNPLTTTENLMNNLLKNDGLNYTLYSKDSKELTNKDYIGTGGYVDIKTDSINKRYYIVVTGDIDGNGTSGAMDAYAIVLHTVSKKELMGKELLAADYNMDNSVGARDAYAIILDSIK